MKPFTLAEYMRTLRLGKRGRNKMIKFSLYDSGDAKKKKLKDFLNGKLILSIKKLIKSSDNTTIDLLL